MAKTIDALRTLVALIEILHDKGILNQREVENILKQTGLRQIGQLMQHLKEKEMLNWREVMDLTNESILEHDES